MEKIGKFKTSVRKKHIVILKKSRPDYELYAGDEYPLVKFKLNHPVKYSNSYDGVIKRRTMFMFVDGATPVEVPVDIYEETTTITRKKI